MRKTKVVKKSGKYFAGSPSGHVRSYELLVRDGSRRRD